MPEPSQPSQPSPQAAGGTKSAAQAFMRFVARCEGCVRALRGGGFHGRGGVVRVERGLGAALPVMFRLALSAETSTAGLRARVLGRVLVTLGAMRLTGVNRLGRLAS